MSPEQLHEMAEDRMLMLPTDNTHWDEGGGFIPDVVVEAYQEGAQAMLRLVKGHITAIITRDFNAVASPFELEQLIELAHKQWLGEYNELSD